MNYIRTNFTNDWLNESALHARLSMTPFTVPVTMDTFKLWIPQPEIEEGSFRENAKKLLLPFSPSLWLAVFGVILVFGGLSAILSPEQFHEEGETEDRGKDGDSSQKKIRIVSNSLVNGVQASVMDFMGGAVAYDIHANASQKFMNFGFGIFIFVTVTAYTANLAAFLTLSGAAQYISGIDEAIAKNIPLCAPGQLQNELVDLYPGANWVFHPTGDSIQDFDDGKCAAILQGWVDIRGSPELQSPYCERNLVRVGHSVLEKPVAFPANKDIVAGLSHWIASAESEGITFDHFLESPEKTCNLNIILDNSSTDLLQELNLTNMVLPFLIFALCLICAVGIWVRKILITKLQANRDEERSKADGDSCQNSFRCGSDGKPSDMMQCPEQPLSRGTSVDAGGLEAIVADVMKELLENQEEVLRKHVARLAEGNVSA